MHSWSRSDCILDRSVCDIIIDNRWQCLPYLPPPPPRLVGGLAWLGLALFVKARAFFSQPSWYVGALQEDRRAAQKAASERFAQFLDEEYVSLGITHRTLWRDTRDAIERKAPAETDILEEGDRRRILDDLVKKLMKVLVLPACQFWCCCSAFAFSLYYHGEASCTVEDVV